MIEAHLMMQIRFFEYCRAQTTMQLFIFLMVLSLLALAVLFLGRQQFSQ